MRVIQGSRTCDVGSILPQKIQDCWLTCMWAHEASGQCRDIMGQNEYHGIPAASGRLSKRTFEEPIAKTYHLNGAGVGIHQSVSVCT